MSTILPILTYALSIKLHLSRTQSSKLVSFERRTERIVGKKVTSIQRTVKTQTVNFVKKCLNDDTCENFHGYFERLTHEISTRNNGKVLKLPKCKLEFEKDLFIF